MARMHTRRRGASGSKRPLLQENPPWVPLEAREVEELVMKLHNEGLTAAQIGLRLRDQYGVPSVRLATGKPLLQLLREGGGKIDVPEDLQALLRRAANLQEHLRQHPRDLHNRRGLELVEAKIRRLARYYKGEGLLPADWDYGMKAAELKAK